ncbi:MAG: excinuclease ABC subunit UvrC [Holosporales bacterium]|jgi:excinuclease ABC subunit C|nr:excinuclease ABC subunit UvrC [Holosporales bacterium]
MKGNLTHAMDQKFIYAVTIIQDAAQNAGLNPGIYKMIDKKHKVIYVGKAKHLKNRLLSYIHIEKLANRLKMMVSNIAKIEFTITNSEIEAFILENNLIKQLKPFYNILLKDDKTFPYIVIDETSDYPRIFKYRTIKTMGNNFFGPYPAVNTLHDMLKIIQKTFLLRSCTDNYFSNRQRPCLQYFIKRCSAPCLGKISKDEYIKCIDFAKNLLIGKDETVRTSLIEQMREASKNLEFEKAAVIRDKIKSITEIQAKQYVQISKTSSIDFIAIAKGQNTSVVFVSFFRSGRNVGSEKFIIQNSLESMDESAIAGSFIMQFYLNVTIPSVIVINKNIENKEHIINYIFTQCKIKTKIIVGNKGIYKKIIDSCVNNAQIQLSKDSSSEYQKPLIELSHMFGDVKINRIETYDNSHIQGTNACGVMIVFEDGKLKREKNRRFNIDKKTANDGDDLNMMKFVLQKRFKSKSIVEKPDLLIIDGGKAQVHAAQQITETLEQKCNIIGIAKQNHRRIGDEKIVFADGKEINLERDSLLLNFLIMLRNEAHKTAIMFHRKKRTKGLLKSELDEINFIGSIRKKKLLEHFGSIENIKKASIEDLKVVQGIKNHYAKVIVDFFNRGRK